MITRTVIILDKSESMQAAWDGTITGYNETISQLKLNIEEGANVLFSLVTFNGNVYEHCWDTKDLNALTPLDRKTYVPSGSTAERDAIGYVIKKLRATAPEGDEPVRYDVTIISDGQTNSDRLIRPTELAELMSQCNEDGNWTFTKMGHDVNAVTAFARAYNVPMANTAVYTTGSNFGVEKAFKAMAASRTKFMRCADLSASAMYSTESSSPADFTLSEEDLAVQGTKPSTTAEYIRQPTLLNHHTLLAKYGGKDAQQ